MSSNFLRRKNPNYHKEKVSKYFLLGGNNFLMKDLFSFCPCKTATLILKAPISLQKTCKLSSVLAAFEVYPLLVVIYSVLCYFKNNRREILRGQFNQIQKTRFTPD